MVFWMVMFSRLNKLLGFIDAQLLFLLDVSLSLQNDMWLFLFGPFYTRLTISCCVSVAVKSRSLYIFNTLLMLLCTDSMQKHCECISKCKQMKERHKHH